MIPYRTKFDTHVYLLFTAIGIMQTAVLAEQPPLPPKPIEDCVQQTNLGVPDIDAHSWIPVDAAALKGTSLMLLRIPAANNIVISGTRRSGAQLHAGGFLLRSSDGGAHWEAVDTAVLIYDIEFRDATHGMAMGDNGIVLATSDGGETWTRMESGQHICSFMGPFSYGNDEVLAFGSDYSHCEPSPYPQRPFIARSTNDGGAWHVQQLPDTMQYTFVRMIRLDATTLVAIAGFGGVIADSFDDGQSWQLHQLSQAGKPIFLADAVKSGPTAILAGVMYAGNNPPVGVVVRREQGNWEPHQVNVLFRGMSVTPSSTIYAISSDGAAAKSSDSGDHWSQNVISPSRALSAIAFESDSTGYIIGVNGLIFKTTNSGVTWVSIGNNQ
jgi:hypothetical protein